MHRWRLRARYHWDQSPDSALITARGVVDTKIRRYVTATSSAGPGGPSFGYAGVWHGIGRIQQVLEEFRESKGAPTLSRTQQKVSRAQVLSGQHVPPADLVAVGCTSDQAARLPAGNALVLPYRLHLVVDMTDGWLNAVSKWERKWIAARRREREWCIERATDEASFHYFYDRMHAPTMQIRHGERTRGESRDSALECLFRDGVLTFATVDGERVAGALCHRSPDGRTITLRLVGVLDGVRQHYDDGALKILYHMLLQWAADNGIRHVDLGGMEAWISKGIFRWKRRLAPRIVLAPNHLGRLRVWWHASRDTPAVRDFLVANPVFEVGSDQRLGAVYFYDDERPPRTDLAFSGANVHQSRMVHLDGFLPKGALPDASIDRIVVR
ncbi:GNAT family N-acetyltransferase [Kibdelosporangium banguiense]|nr:GNAT family N-acetyltransferase [Kibdelosporangium banguiense]